MWAAELKEWTPTKANVTGSVQDFSHCPDSPLITSIPVICPSMSPQWETWHPFTCCRGSVCNVQTCALTKTHRSYRCLFIQLCNDWTVWLQQDKQDHTTINYFIIINRCLLFYQTESCKSKSFGNVSIFLIFNRFFSDDSLRGPCHPVFSSSLWKQNVMWRQRLAYYDPTVIMISKAETRKEMNSYDARSDYLSFVSNCFYRARFFCENIF